jgi:Ca-activated chloride channel family protein
VSYLEPVRLWFLAGVAALTVVYVVMQRRRKKYAVRFTNLALLDQVAPKRPGWRRHAPALAFILALAALVMAFARPTHEGKVPRERATIILAIDTSVSMEATDVPPTRIKAAQDAAKSFLQTVPEKVNIGLVSFNGTTTVDVAPTTDRQRVELAIDNLTLGPRTAIGEAIFTSLDVIQSFGAQTHTKSEEPVPASIVLMSDGETTIGRSNEEASAAALKAQVPVTTIAFGTDHGEIILPESPNPIQVAVNRTALRQIADATGGAYYSAATEEQLASVYGHIGSSVGFETKELEITSWFIGASLLAMLATAGMSLAWFSRLP